MLWLVGLLSLFPFSLAQVCSLYSNPPSVTSVPLFDYSIFTASTPIIKTWTSVVDGKLRLAADETNGGTVGYAWHNARERIADGFVSEFSFMVTSSNASTNGDGFTYFIQNDRITDLNGGTGEKLGAFGIGNSIAIRFDLCANRPSHPCISQQVGLTMVNSTYGVLAPSLVKNLNLTTNITDGLPHTVVVTYGGRPFGDAAQLRVELDGQDLFGDVTVGDLSGPKLFNDRFAHFGFTASTSWEETANIDILSWRTVMVPSDSQIVSYNTTGPNVFYFDTTAEFIVQARDSCGNPRTDNVIATITSTLFQVPASASIDPLDYVTLIGNVTNNMNGTFSIFYNLPIYEGVWDLSVKVNGVLSENMPWFGGVRTIRPPPPPPPGFPIWALVLLLLVILLIIAALTYVVYRLHRYRKKLKENAEFIEAGKEQAKLDRLEDGMKYNMNPMVGTLDDLKAQLTKNEEELARLKALGELGESQSYTIESLQKQRNNLMEEMGRLKKEEQEEELKKVQQTEATGAGTRQRKEFGQEQAHI